MKFEDIAARVGHVPFITRDNARYLYELVLKERLCDVLELGIAHGTATCFIAAALDELGRGQVTAVDLEQMADHFQPSAEQQLAATGLGKYAQIVRMQSGYSWYLHDAIREQSKDDVCSPCFDLCVIDGPKNWTIDGGAFFLVDKLLRPGGYIIFDDYHWTYGSRQRAATDGITHRELSQVERETPHIREVFELLVKQHPHYGHFELRVGADWAIARKSSEQPKTYRVHYELSAKDLVAKAALRVLRRFTGSA